MAIRKPIEIGGVFNNLTILEDLGMAKRYVRRCKVLCTCGVVKEVAYQKVRNGTTTSCGCVRKRMISEGELRRTHGESNTPLYKVYYGMLDRCHNPKSSGYNKYGAKGITVCTDWKESYENFATWAKHLYSKGLSIDRIDNTKGYSPTNCRWASYHTQAVNRGKSSNNKSGYKNIHYNTSKGFFVARFTKHGKRKEFRGFATAEAANTYLNNYLEEEGLYEERRSRDY